MKVINVISGLPRSGTSTMSRIIQQSGVSYIGEAFKGAQLAEAAVAANPLGYYECDWSVRGWYGQDNTVPGGSWCKVFAMGLRNSSPDLIGEIVWMARNPLEQTRSRIRLAAADGHRLPQPNPHSYLIEVGLTAGWIISNKKTPLVVDFNSLIDDTGAVCDRVSAVVGRQLIPDRVDPLTPKNRGNGDPSMVSWAKAAWDKAERVHHMILQGDWEGVHMYYLQRVQLGKGKNKPPIRGLGDLVAKTTKAVGIQPCGGCKKRQDTLNRLIPFSQSQP